MSRKDEDKADEDKVDESVASGGLPGLTVGPVCALRLAFASKGIAVSVEVMVGECSDFTPSTLSLGECLVLDFLQLLGRRHYGLSIYADFAASLIKIVNRFIPDKILIFVNYGL